MERAAELVETMVNNNIESTSVGLTRKEGFLKHKTTATYWNVFFDGQYPTDKKELENRLHRVRLKLGLIEQRVPDFLASSPAPIASISVPLSIRTVPRPTSFIFCTYSIIPCITGPIRCGRIRA